MVIIFDVLTRIMQANTENELPELLLGTCRLNYLDVSKSVQER